MSEDSKPTTHRSKMGGAVRQRVRRARWLSQAVRERRRFIVREALPRRAVSRYRLSGDGTRVSIRHHEHGLAAGSGDAFTLYEVFHSPDYEFPAVVEKALSDRPGTLTLADVGANLGFFSLRTLSRFPGARVIAFEPDADNARLLRTNLSANGLEAATEVIEACAYTEAGTLSFVGGKGSMSHVDFDQTGGAPLPAVDVFPYLEGADLIKLDIEGGEWPLLADSRFPGLSAAAIVLEYHSVACPGENARQEATDRLRESGYEVLHPQPDRFPSSGAFWGASVLWAYRAS